MASTPAPLLPSAARGGGGSGGSIRVVATTITGTGGTISVSGGAAGRAIGCSTGGTGGIGRIRIEATNNTSTVTYTSPPSLGQPGVVTLPSTPSLRIASVAGSAAPTSPTGSYALPDITLPTGTSSPVNVVVTGSNIPSGTLVTVTSSGLAGGTTSVTGTLTGSPSSTASVSLAIPTNEPTVISAWCTFTLASIGGGPVYAEGEEVELVRVSATVGRASQVTWITRSGREIPAGRVP